MNLIDTHLMSGSDKVTHKRFMYYNKYKYFLYFMRLHHKLPHQEPVRKSCIQTRINDCSNQNQEATTVNLDTSEETGPMPGEKKLDYE